MYFNVWDLKAPSCVQRLTDLLVPVELEWKLTGETTVTSQVCVNIQLHTSLPTPLKGGGGTGKKNKRQEISFLENVTVLRKGAWAFEEKPARQMLPYSTDQFILLLFWVAWKSWVSYKEASLIKLKHW